MKVSATGARRFPGKIGEVKWSYGDFAPRLSAGHDIPLSEPFFGPYVERDGEVIAYTTVKAITEDEGRKLRKEIVCIDIVSVDINYRRMGLGTVLVQEVLDFLLAGDVVYVYPMSREGKKLLDHFKDSRLNKGDIQCWLTRCCNWGVV